MYIMRATAATVVSSMGLVYGEDPWELAPPQALACDSNAAFTDSLIVTSKVDPTVADVVSFMVARSDDPERWPFLHHSVPVSLNGDGEVHANVSGLESGTGYLLMARAHKRGEVLGWHKKWSQVVHRKQTCHTAASWLDFGSIADSHISGDEKPPATRWIELYRRNGPTFFSQSAMQEPTNNYTLPDFLENHNAFGSPPSDPGMLFGSENFTNASFSRYCVELEDITFTNVTTPGYQFGGLPGDAKPVTSKYADYLSCNKGSCESMICGDRVVYLSHKQMKQECPMSPEQEEWVAKHYIANETNIPQKQQQECFYSQLSKLGFRECLAPNLAQSLRYVGYAAGLVSFPIDGQCAIGSPVGADGCTWRESPTVLSLSQGHLMEAGVFDATKSFEERVAAAREAYAAIGAQPCGSQSGGVAALFV